MQDTAPLASTALLIGCGYLGRRVAARLLDAGVTAYATTRQPARARQLAELGLRPLLLDVTQPLTFAALTPALEADTLDVLYLVPPGSPRQDPPPDRIVREGIANVVAAVGKSREHGRLRRAVLTSSTAVYGQTGGARVDADTPAEPADPRGELLLEGERLWLDGLNGREATPTVAHVARLAGLYGPQRVVGRRAIHDAAPLIGDPQAMLNLIHVDDAADLLLAILRADAPSAIELGADGAPTPRLDYYTHLAGLLDRPPPIVLDNSQAARALNLNTERLRRTSSKACDPAPTMSRTGWTPSYPDFRAGLAAILRPDHRPSG